MALMFLARLPMTMNGVMMTLYVVTGLGRGYGAAGLVGAGITLGMALGAPLLGRCLDRYGLRPVVAVCGIGTTAFWWLFQGGARIPEGHWATVGLRKEKSCARCIAGDSASLTGAARRFAASGCTSFAAR